jgi:hypothetical protein
MNYMYTFIFVVIPNPQVTYRLPWHIHKLEQLMSTLIQTGRDSTQIFLRLLLNERLTAHPASYCNYGFTPIPYSAKYLVIPGLEIRQMWLHPAQKIKCQLYQVKSKFNV